MQVIGVDVPSNGTHRSKTHWLSSKHPDESVIHSSQEGLSGNYSCDRRTLEYSPLTYQRVIINAHRRMEVDAYGWVKVGILTVELIGPHKPLHVPHS